MTLSISRALSSIREGWRVSKLERVQRDLELYARGGDWKGGGRGRDGMHISIPSQSKA